ncbi:putative F-box protein AUF1 [Helianthus debilis subsp. tardiflorus]
MGIDQNSEVDVFDLLPDALVLEVFNRVEDVKSLSACSVLCKRFGDLVAQTQNVSLEITRRKTLQEEVSKGWHMNKSKGLIARFVLKPLHALVHRMVSRKSKTCCDDEDDDMFRLPNDLLKNFKEIRSLSVKLPGHDGDISSENGSGALLKWKAEFGKQLDSCVILGATGFQKRDETETLKSEAPAASNLTNKQLKKRVVWTISCLIASSARHHMLKQIISWNHRTIRDVKISDGSKQGTIQMTEKQVVELRKEMDKVVGLERTKVPAVTIKMWYVPVLELPESGGVMKGATLAVIRPTTVPVEKEDDVTLATGAFGEDFTAEAVRKLVHTNKSYTLEMNSF